MGKRRSSRLICFAHEGGLEKHERGRKQKALSNEPQALGPEKSLGKEICIRGFLTPPRGHVRTRKKNAENLA